MTLSIAILLALFALMTLLFLLQLLPLEVTALLFLVFLTLLGYLSAEEAVSGFSSPTVITLIGMFFLSTSLKETGVSNRLGGMIERAGGKDEKRILMYVMAATAFVSAFMNNMSAAALMLPVVIRVAQRTAISPSRLLMPMAFASVLGGMLTLVGTQPNIIAADLLRRAGLEPFHFLSFTPFGGAAVVLGIFVVVVFGRRFLPSTVEQSTGRAELAELYRLNERLIRMQVPKRSSIHGKTLAELQFGGALGARVLSITRGGQRRHLPGARDVLHDGDTLVVGGRREDIEAMRRFNGLSVEPIDAADLAKRTESFSGAKLRVSEGGELVGRSIRDVRFHERYGALVLRIEREGEILSSDLAALPLAPGDVLHVAAVGAPTGSLSDPPELTIVGPAVPLEELCGQHFFLLRIGDGVGLSGTAVRDSRLSEIFGVTVAGIVRDGSVYLPVNPAETLRADDGLVVTGDPERVRNVARLGELEVLPDTERSEIESSDLAMVEVVLSPRSDLVGRSLGEIGFREKYGMQVLAIWREGRPRRARLGDLRLSLGDALLLQLPRDRLAALQRDPDFVVISEPPSMPRSTGRAWVAISGFLLLTLLPIFNVLRVDLAALTAAMFVVLGGAVRMEEVYREIEWKVVLLVAALLPFATALEKSGAAGYLADGLLGSLSGVSPYFVLATLCILSSALSQFIDASVAVITLGPIALRAAEQLGLSPYPLMMGVALFASVTFLSPISNRSNLLVMGAGNYRSRDYFLPGLLLTIALVVLFLALLPIVYPFRG